MVFYQETVDNIRAIIGIEQLYYLKNCSHNPYLDRQIEFLKLLKQEKG